MCSALSSWHAIYRHLEAWLCLQEASLAWEKRQAGIRARRQKAESQDRWNKWAAANGVATGHAAKASRDEDSETSAAPNDTASAAARAARRYAFCVAAFPSMSLLLLLPLPSFSSWTPTASCHSCAVT